MAVKLLSEHNLRKAERSSGMSTLRKVLISLMIVGGIGSTVSAGTYASYTAETRNAGSAFASGTLVLNRQVGVTACLSVGASTNTDANTNAACSLMFSPNRVKLGDAATTVDLMIENQGTTGGTLFYQAMDADSGTIGNQACLNSNNDVGYNGAGNMCSSTNITIQEYTSAAYTTAKTACVYPAQAGSACPGLVATLAPTHLPSALPTTATSLGVMTVGEKRYYRISMNLPNTVTDSLQGRVASLGLTWTLTG